MLSAMALAGILVTGCGSDPRPNVILVSVDTLRADALKPYGGPIPTPALQRLAEEGVLFERALAPAPSTGPSHASLLTGLEVLHHRVVSNGQELPANLETLAEVFSREGYETAAFVSSFVLDRRFGWNRGFDRFDDELPEEHATARADPAHPGRLFQDQERGGIDRPGDLTVEAATEWLKSADGPWFLFVHLFDPHRPYAPPPTQRMAMSFHQFDVSNRHMPGLKEQDLDMIARLYHGEVSFVDETIGTLLEAADAADSSRSRLVVFTADHGEGLGEHGHVGHASHLYDELLHVPLIFHWTGKPVVPRRIDSLVGLVDVAPTIAELVGLPPLPRADGISLASTIESEAAVGPRIVLAHKKETKAEKERWRPERHALTAARWKLIRSSEGPLELFDLESDPGELRSVHDENPEVLERLSRILDDLLASTPDPLEQRSMSPEVRAALRALGYVYADDE